MTGREDLFTRKSEELTGQRGGMVAGFVNFLNHSARGLAVLQFLQQQIAVSRDNTQDVIKVMGHSPREHADSFHAMSLDQKAFEILLLRNVGIND